MANQDGLLKMAQDQRTMAAHVRRLARGLSLNDDHHQMMKQADELEAEAAQLERQTTAAADPYRP